MKKKRKTYQSMVRGVCGQVQRGCDGIGGWTSRGSLRAQEDGDVVAAIVLQRFEVKQKQGKKTLNSVFW